MVPEGLGAALEDIAPWPDWPAAASGVVEFLHGHVGWDVWMVTRVSGGHQTVLCSSPTTTVQPGAHLPWEESLCRAMTEGTAPRLATVTAAVPEYAALTLGRGRNVAAYVGVPLLTVDRRLFGALCGVAFRAKPLSAARDLPVVEAVARLLSTLLAASPGPPPLPPPLPTPRAAS